LPKHGLTAAIETIAPDPKVEAVTTIRSTSAGASPPFQQTIRPIHSPKMWFAEYLRLFLRLLFSPDSLIELRVR